MEKNDKLIITFMGGTIMENNVEVILSMIVEADFFLRLFENDLWW